MKLYSTGPLSGQVENPARGEGRRGGAAHPGVLGCGEDDLPGADAGLGIDQDEPRRLLEVEARLERIDVLPAWKKVWNQPRTDIETCLELYGKRGSGPDEEGW